MALVCRVKHTDWGLIKVMCTDLGTTTKEGAGEIGKCSKGTMKLIKGFENNCCGERLKEL